VKLFVDFYFVILRVFSFRVTSPRPILPKSAKKIESSTHSIPSKLAKNHNDSKSKRMRVARVALDGEK
jgi:hypothetical protein